MIAAIYARKSTEQSGVNDEERSVVRQVEHAKAYAEEKGWTVTEEHIYVDDGISGAEFDNRPGFLRLMNALKPKPPFQFLIMSEESRLGRESIQTAYALKQLVTAGVRVFFYLEDRERTLDTPIDKVMLSLTTFADELERDKARQRTYDAMMRKVKALQVTGGCVFGYDNRRTGGHVDRVINEQEAEIVREIFRLCAQGKGLRKIAQELNRRGIPSPRPRRAGRQRSWAPSTIREMLHRDLYRGLLIWNKTRKRDQWGQKRYIARPESEWIRLEVPQWQIVPNDLWKAAHDRLATGRDTYLRKTNGQLWGRPASGLESKYLLTGLAQCAECGSSMIAWRGRYRCYYNYTRGKGSCSNNLPIFMPLTHRTVLATIEQDVLQPQVIEAAIKRALDRLQPSGQSRQEGLRGEIDRVEGELERLSTAIASGGDLPSLLEAVREREKRRGYLLAELQAAEGLGKIAQLDLDRILRTIRDRLTDWQGLLERHPTQTRQILRKLLVGRLIFTPHEDESGRYYVFNGEGALDRILEGTIPVVTRAGVEPAAPCLKGRCSAS